MKHKHEHSFSTTWISVNPHTTKIQQAQFPSCPEKASSPRNKTSSQSHSAKTRIVFV